MIRKIKVSGNTAIPLPDRLEGTHQLDLTEDQYNRFTGARFFVVENGEPRAITAQEEADMNAADAAAAEANRISALRNACLNYQAQEFRCDSNFYGLLMAAKASGAAGVKSAACLTQLDLLWSLYEAMKSDSELEEDFSPAGVIPHSFDEVRAEIEAV